MHNNSLPKISAPAMRALQSIGVTTLSDLPKHTEKEIAQLHGMGPKALGILKEALRSSKLSFSK